MGAILTLMLLEIVERREAHSKYKRAYPLWISYPENGTENYFAGQRDARVNVDECKLEPRPKKKNGTIKSGMEVTRS